MTWPVFVVVAHIVCVRCHHGIRRLAIRNTMPRSIFSMIRMGSTARAIRYFMRLSSDLR
jgi:hypothetical protein